jgi:hypothetical protein
MTQNYKEYWKSDNLNNVVPGGIGANPEGFDAIDFVSGLISKSNHEEPKVIDFGCGWGRFSKAVPKDRYIGVDINPDAIALAKQQNPGYSFIEVNESDEYPVADVCMAYTVFLHIDDTLLSHTIDRLIKSDVKTFIVAEILGREWRRDGDPPVFNRNLDDYVDIFRRKGFYLNGSNRELYRRYLNHAAQKNIWLYGLVFEKIDIDDLWDRAQQGQLSR